MARHVIEAAGGKHVILEAMPIAQQQERLGGELLRIDPLAIGQGMAARQHRAERIGKERPLLDPVPHRVRERDQRRIEPACPDVIDQPGGEVLGEIDGQARIAGAELGPEAGEEEGADGRDHPEMKPPRQGLALGGGEFDQFLGLGEDDPGAIDDLAAQGGERHAAPGAVHQRRAEQVLEFLETC